MISFIIKSTVCLVLLYGFFHLFLRHHKILIFNRVYLILSLVFSMIIPLVIIPVQSNFILNNSLEKLTFTSGQVSQQITNVENSSSPYSFQNILIALFIFISSVLVIRFTLNIFRILRKIVKSKKVVNLRSSFVLVQEKTLPYSFFKYIFVNQSDFENGKIEKELLMHEEAHCLQYHSIDLILL